MSWMKSIINKIRSDERGSEVIEWVLICGLITVVAIVSIAGVGTKAAARWTSVNSLVP